MSQITSVKFRLATDEDKTLQAYDNTKLQAYNTCPTWGVLRYQMHLRMPGAGRALALEAGSALHEVFAWVRLLTLVKHLPTSIGQDAYVHHGRRVFGVERFAAIREQIYDASSLAEDDLAKAGAIAVLESGGFYDDPNDRRRTLSNMTECAFAYIDRWNWKSRVWMRDETDPTSDVGIEIPFDLVVETSRDHGLTHQSRRYTGKIDGIHVDDKGTVILHENKTASRLNDAWSMSFAVNSQPTGYMLAASTFVGKPVRNAKIHGLSIPLPKSWDFGGVITEHVTRQDFHFRRWVEWFVSTAEGYERNADDPVNAQRYTHSCNRYFRPCSMIPFCDADDEDERQMLKEMEHHEWSPLHTTETPDEG